MQLERVGIRTIPSAARVALWGTLVAALALALAGQAWRGGRETAALRRQSASLDRQVARMKGVNQSLRSELEALRSDPVYVESLVRGWKRVGAHEHAVD